MKTLNLSEIHDERQWTLLFNEFGSSSFLQSFEWGEVQRRHGYGISRLVIYENKRPVGLSLVLFVKARRGNMIFVPHGPIVIQTADSFLKKAVLKKLTDYLKEEAKTKKYHFIRIAPIWENTQSDREVFTELGFRTAPIYMHAERVWMLDLRKSEEELLKDMRKTTRYSIRKAEKEGVEIRTDGDIGKFWDIYEITAERENFTPFSKEFIKSEYEEFKKTGHNLFLNGFLPDKKTCAASALIVLTKSTAFYHQGATTHSKIPVSYLLQWRAIQEAKKRGCIYYNFWGTLQPRRTPRTWSGLSLFKQGFGGFQRDYVPTQDYIIDPLRYAFSYLFEVFLRWRRGV